jgi:hypothetical protein
LNPSTRNWRHDPSKLYADFDTKLISAAQNVGIYPELQMGG